MALKRKATAAIATFSLVALIVSGTFAWTNLNSQRVNEWRGAGSPGTGPGGTLHDDHNNDVDNDQNKQVYIENWGNEPLYVRVKLGEYMEVGTGSGLKSLGYDPSTGQPARNPGNQSTPILGLTGNANLIDYPDKWKVVWYGDRLNVSGDNPTGIAPWYRLSSYWDWQTGGQKYYYPAPESSWTDKNYIDQSSPDDLTAASVNSDGVKAKQTLKATIMSMEAWKAADSPIGNYWVIDRSDGWAYWASALQPGDATGLLLDKVIMAKTAGNYAQYFDLSKSYYYGINVHAEMATKDGTEGDLDNYKSFGADGWTTDGQLLMDKIVNADRPADTQPHQFTLAFGAGGTHQPQWAYDPAGNVIPGGVYDQSTDTVTAQIKAGTQLTVSALANPGFVFYKWVSSDGSGTFTDATRIGTTFIMPDNNVTVTATFKPDTSGNTDNVYTVTMVYDAGGSFPPINPSVGAYNLGENTYQVDYNAGATVQLIAQSFPGYVFDKWISSDDSVAFSSQDFYGSTFVMPEGDVTITATFKPVDDASVNN